ncbi:hypothetical protein F5141DRAFT_1102396 [Pisolithus sp. B1]|nr:hypothetical protein F5141DRAFT_1102396 [Pisolithus sp. B1]
MDSDNHMLVDIPAAVDEPDDVVRWVPSQTSNPVLQALIHQAEQDKKSESHLYFSLSLPPRSPLFVLGVYRYLPTTGQPSLPCISEPLWTHTLPSTTSTLWPSSTAPPALCVSSLPSFGDTSFPVPPLNLSGSDPSSSSSGSGRAKISSVGAHRKPLSASANHPARSGRTASKHDPLSKRPRSSSHSTSSNAVKERPKTSLADREQDPDAAAFLALLRDVSKQLDDNAKKKQMLSTVPKDQRQRVGGEGVEAQQPPLRGDLMPPPEREKGKEKERARAGGSHDLSLNDSNLIPNISLESVSPRMGQRSGETFGVPCRNTNVLVKSTVSVQPYHDPVGRPMMGPRTIMRVSSMDPNVPSRRSPVSHTRNLCRTTSTSTIASGSDREHATSLAITPTFDRHMRLQEPVSGSITGGHLKRANTVTEDSFMAVDPVSSFPQKNRSVTAPDNSKLQSATCTQSSIMRSTLHHPPALGMRRAVVTSNNGSGSASVFPSSSQYSTSSQPPKATAVPRFKPPLRDNAPPKPPILKSSTESTCVRLSAVPNRTKSDIARHGVGARPRSPIKVACTSPETDPDSSFDISFDLDADMLEEAMRPYD